MKEQSQYVTATFCTLVETQKVADNGMTKVLGSGGGHTFGWDIGYLHIQLGYCSWVLEDPD